MNGPGALDVVIVSATGSVAVLRRCLASLREHPYSLGPMTVHVVDNDSQDGTPDMVEREFPEVHLHRMPRNLGFSVANNVVLRSSAAPWVLVLNPDTESRAGALDHMVLAIQARPDVGMAGCRLEQPDGTFDHAAKRGFPTPVGALAHFTRIGRARTAGAQLAQYRAPDVDERGTGDVDAVNGAFMLVRQDALRDVGLFDEAYWLYMEDLDWCYRFHQRGWKVLYDGSVTFLHVKGGTSKVGQHRSLRLTVAFHRSMGRYYRKFLAGQRPALDVLIYFAILGKLCIACARSVIARRSVA